MAHTNESNERYLSRVPFEEKRLLQMEHIVNKFAEESHKFMPTKLIKEKCLDLIDEEFKKGGHRKINSKKLRKKLHDRNLIYHSKIYKTYVIAKIIFGKKSISYSFATISYFHNSGGTIYVHRSGDNEFPSIQLFTSHFFDRLVQRGYGEDGMGRERAILTYLVDFMEVQKQNQFSVYNDQNSEFFSYMGHGIGIGNFAFFPTRLEFLFHKEIQIPISHMTNVRLFMTYCDLSILSKEQQSLVSQGKDMMNQISENEWIDILDNLKSKGDTK